VKILFSCTCVKIAKSIFFVEVLMGKTSSRIHMIISPLIL